MTTFEKVVEIIEKDFLHDDTKVKAEDTADSLGLDSLDIVELIMAVEKEYSIDIDDDKVENSVTVGKFVEYIDTLLK